MTQPSPVLANVGAAMSGVLYVCQALANYRDAIEGSTEWRKGLEADLVAKAKNISLDNVPLTVEPMLYEAIFGGIRLALVKSENGQPPSIRFE